MGAAKFAGANKRVVKICFAPLVRTQRDSCPLTKINKLGGATNAKGCAMPSEELGRVLQMPVSCSHCPKYSDQPVAFVLTKEKIKCPDCGGEIDLTTKEWFAFRRKFSEVLAELQPLYKQIP